jgi:hypothetical protein
VIGSPRERARLSAGAREHASRLGWSVTVDRLLDLYSDLMTQAPRITGPMDAQVAEPDAAR